MRWRYKVLPWIKSHKKANLYEDMATIKQKLTASKLVENGGNVGKAMLEAGYSEAMAKNPQKLTRSKGWQELIDKFISEDRLLNVHKRMLDCVKLMSLPFELSTSDEDIRKIISKVCGSKFVSVNQRVKAKVCFYTMPENGTRLSALDMAYKIRGKYQIDNEEQKRNASLDTAIERINRLLPDAEL